MKFRKPKFTTILICLGLFFAFLIISFPFKNLKGYIFGQIHKNTRILIMADEIYLSLFGWPGIGMKNVNVTLPMGRNEIDISCRKMVFRVGLGSLIPPTPSVSLSMIDLKEGGDLYLKFTKGSERIEAEIDARKLELGQLDFPGLSDTIKGKLSAEGEFDINQAQLPTSKGNLQLVIRGFHVPPQNLQGFILPDMKMGDVNGLVQIQNGSITTNRFQIGSPDSGFQGSINGDLRLAQTFQQSFLNLTLKIKLSEEYRKDPNSATLVSFLKTYEHTPGDYGLRWSATLRGMSTNLMNAIPQKAFD